MACRQCHPTPCCTVLAKAVSNFANRFRTFRSVTRSIFGRLSFTPVLRRA